MTTDRLTTVYLPRSKDIVRVDLEDIFSWCYDFIGAKDSKWNTTLVGAGSGIGFIFVNESDATLFALKWR